MKSEEARQRRAGHIIAAAQKSQHWSPDYGNNSRDLRPNFRREERQLVPRQQVTAKPETDGNEQKKHAAQPGQLARRIVSAHKEDAEHVYEKRGDHKIGGPAVNRANQPAELDLSHDELHAFKSVF